ncbi:hypothetical protein [Cyanobium gracile]|uniref:Uncharacterized protein n=1 Tax=Cyanobium gracile UHCC 0281 TaxID=3110309 RepID=A0ABU5SUK4_9CYAN|nr:hypothetical protein [Cyanobium gracile]MEA5442201.1 hypothetical protein [Cyanobium gracile UHCC 0281]
MSPPLSRPELSNLLLEAVHRRDTTATARLSRQWAHRHGVGSLEQFRTGSLMAQQGSEASEWLRQHLEGPDVAPTAPGSERPKPIAPGVDDAFAALEAAFSTPPVPDVEATAHLALVPEPVSAAMSLPEASRLSVLPPGTPPAPAPSTLAGLRSWLSGDPQHRRAS